jgi:inosine-uridine nucleoside N-ribohydrolase
MYCDMDPGIDDAAALVVAAGRTAIDGVMTVAGNVEADKTLANAGRLLRVLGLEDVPLVAGAGAPILHRLVTAPHVHGSTGLDGYPFPRGVRAPTSEEPAWRWLARELVTRTRPAEIVATAPLTNLARFLAAFGDEAYRQRVGSVTIMGGSLSGGNVTPTAEFNFYADPVAADWVLGSGWPIRIVGLDVTTVPGIPVHELDRLAQYGEVGQMLEGLLGVYAQNLEAIGEAVDVVYLHDVAAVAAALRPDLYTFTPMRLRVIPDGEFRGTLVTESARTGRATVEYATAVDADGFRAWFWESLQRFRDA